MSLGGKLWTRRIPDPAAAGVLQESLGLSPVLARLLVGRGLKEPEAARAYLEPDLAHLGDPLQMAGVAEALGRIDQALSAGENIFVYGDYDADGVTATAILLETLETLGGRAFYHLPSRFKGGYGLQEEALRSIAARGAGLVITVDCGANARREAEVATNLGLDLIVTDHHRPLHSPDRALALINPLQDRCSYPFKELSGAGIAFKLACALYAARGLPFPRHLLDLAALGTAADVAPLVGENRLIVAGGLREMQKLRRPGLRALAAAVGLKSGSFSARSLSFMLGPALNAAGRLGEADPALELLLTSDPGRAADLASYLHKANGQRRTLERQILQEAEKAIEKQPSGDNEKTIVLAGEGWHRGVIGIVASRLVERYYRPVFLVAIEEGLGRGSARGIPGFDVTAALAACSEELERFGGHEQAAGFSLLPECFPALARALRHQADAEIDPIILRPRLEVETELSEEELNLELLDEMAKMEPLGAGNPPPLLGSRGWELKSWRSVGSDDSHLRLEVERGGQRYFAVYFGAAQLIPQLEKGRLLDLAFTVQLNSFQQKESLDIRLADIAYGDSYRLDQGELIDRRNSSGRLELLAGLLGGNSREAVIYAATAARARYLAEKLALPSAARLVSGGNPPGPPATLQDGALILYDLPLYPGTLKKLLGGHFSSSWREVILLFGHDNLALNRLILDHAFPTAAALEKVAADLSHHENAVWNEEVTAALARRLDFKPLPAYWTRVRKILAEVGALEEEGGLVRVVPLGGREAELHPLSATFREGEDLRNRCTLFQHRLLESPPGEIEALLRELLT